MRYLESDRERPLSFLITLSEHVPVYRGDSLLGDEIPLRGFGRERHGNVQICLGYTYASFFVSREGVLGKKKKIALLN